MADRVSFDLENWHLVWQFMIHYIIMEIFMLFEMKSICITGAGPITQLRSSVEKLSGIYYIIFPWFFWRIYMFIKIKRFFLCNWIIIMYSQCYCTISLSHDFYKKWSWKHLLFHKSSIWWTNDVFGSKFLVQVLNIFWVWVAFS